jgi:beta-glucuronidase
MLAPQTNSHRLAISLDGLWKFRVQTTADDAAEWPRGFSTDRVAAVPASFNEQFTDYDTFNHMGKVWYARSFEVPAALADHDLWLHFAAVNYRADVYLNGQHLGSHETGYTPFAFPINSCLVEGENLLVVRVDCALSPTTVPQGGFDKAAIPGLSSPFKPSVNFDFFPYSGIHRSVSLLALPRTRVESLFIDTTIDGSEGVVHVRGMLSVPAARVGFGIAELSDSSDAADVRLVGRLIQRHAAHSQCPPVGHRETASLHPRSHCFQQRRRHGQLPPDFRRAHRPNHRRPTAAQRPPGLSNRLWQT